MNQENNAPYLERTNNGQSFVGSDVDIFRALAMASGLRLYAATGMKPSRMATPTAMLKAAGAITGKVYKRGQYEQAAADLTEFANILKATPRT